MHPDERNSVGAFVRERGYFVRRLEHPAFAPRIDDPVLLRLFREERKRHFENDRVNVLSRAVILPRIDEAVITVRVLLVFVSLPCPWPGRKVLLPGVSEV